MSEKPFKNVSIVLDNGDTHEYPEVETVAMHPSGLIVIFNGDKKDFFNIDKVVRHSYTFSEEEDKDDVTDMGDNVITLQ